MAFEQSQKTRVESKQYSGDWAGFIAPQGNGGHATEPYYKPSQGIDFTPLANGINKVVDDYDKGRGGRGGSGDGDSGEFINRAYDIVELNTDSNGVLSARGEEQIRHLRRQMGQAGYTDSKIQTVLSAVGQDYKSTTQGMMQEAQRKHVVDEEKDLAKKGVELYPELTGRTLAEQAEAGRNYYKNMNLLSAALEAASNPNSSKSIHDAAISEAADTFLSLIGSDKLNKVLTGEVNADDQLELANQITNSLIQGGVATNIREARALGVELSASFVGKSRENRTAMEKLTVEEKDRYIELKKNEARTGLYKTDPVLATKLALVNWDLTKLPEEYLTFLTDFDASKIGGNGTEHYWQGAFDARTANICVQNGTPCVADAGQRAINDQGLKNNDADSANQVLQSMMSENMRGILNRPEMAAQRPAAVQAYKQQLAGLLVNELRPHVLPKTSYVPSENRAGDVGFWNTADKINPIMNKWKDAMRYIGMSDDEIVETGKNAMSALGVAVPDNTTNPESFYQDSVNNIERWMLENPVKRNIPFLDKSGESYVGISRALNDYRDGKITEEEAIAQMGASMNELNRDLNDGGIVNPESVGEAETRQLNEGTINVSAIENDVLASKEYKDAVEAISQDVTMSANEKSQAAASKFSELVQRFTDAAKEIAGVKSAQAAVVPPSMIDKGVKLINELVGIRTANAYEAGLALTRLNEMSPALEKKHSKGNNYLVYKDDNGHLTVGHGFLLDREGRELIRKRGYTPYLGHQIPKEVVDKLVEERYQEKTDLVKRQFARRGIEMGSVPSEMVCLATDLAYIGKPVIGFFDKGAKYLKAKTPAQKRMCIAELKKHINEKIEGNKDRKQRLLDLVDNLDK